MAEPKGSAPLFAALGDATRLRLVARLCDDGPTSITRLTAGSNVTRQAITKHLRVMEEAGLVRSARHGRESVWRLDQRRLEDARHYLQLISEHWDNALGRLRELVEDSQQEGPAYRSHRKARVGSG
jgi:DNA-binding transcriptional ArsR family regulator